MSVLLHLYIYIWYDEPLPRAKASTCRAAIRVAEGVVRDIGEQVASSSSGLVPLSKCTVSHSERDFQVVAKRYQLHLPVQITSLNKTPGVRYTGDFAAISLRHWLSFHLEYNTFHILTGLSKPDSCREQKILQEFWRRFQLLEPHHDVWNILREKDADTSRLVPILLHGDEGRGRKKSAFLVTAYHSILGFGTINANKARKHRPYLSMKLNYAGNAHTHRMVSCVLPKMARDEIAFQDILRFITDDCLGMINEGVKNPHDGLIYRALVLQVVGDWQFLVKAGSLSRSYANVEKRPRAASSNPKGICHLCKAGQLNVPFEDLKEGAVWQGTLHDPTDTPFIRAPQLLRLPHVGSKPSSFFCYDLWHAYHLGVGKTFCASVLALMSMQMPGGNIELRFSELTARYIDFCDEAHESPFILSISKETLGWPDTKTFPNAQWSKGHVTTLMQKFILHYFERNPLDESVDSLFPKCFEAAKCINEFMEKLYSSDVWLDSSFAISVAERGQRFLNLYQALAAQAFGENRALFVYMPKIHIMSHVVLNMKQQARTAPHVLNPLCFAVQVDEDYIGKCSRVSRRTGPGQVILRTLQRSLAASYKHYVASGYLRVWYHVQKATVWWEGVTVCDAVVYPASISRSISCNVKYKDK